MNKNFRKISLVLMILLYLLAGINHFIHPIFYLAIIPSYLPAHEIINYTAGICEIAGSLFLIFSPTRKFAAWVIILMLLAFMPAHIYMLQQAPLQAGSLTITPFVALIRIPLQAVLVLWAYNFTKMRFGI